MMRVGLVVLFVWTLTVRGFAQFDTATVLGSVKDATGAVLPGVTVTLANIETGVTVSKVTDADGAYEFFTGAPWPLSHYRGALGLSNGDCRACATDGGLAPPQPSARFVRPMIRDSSSSD